MSIKVGWRGRLYEDFQVGDVYEHPLGRTILAADNSWFSLLTMYYVTGSKMWVTNGRYAQIFLLLAKTDPAAQPAHRGMSAFVIEKGEPGLTVGRDIDKMGYKTVETVDLHFDNFPVPVANLIGGVEGLGFKQVMLRLSQNPPIHSPRRRRWRRCGQTARTRRRSAAC